MELVRDFRVILLGFGGKWRARKGNFRKGAPIENPGVAGSKRYVVVRCFRARGKLKIRIKSDSISNGSFSHSVLQRKLQFNFHVSSFTIRSHAKYRSLSISHLNMQSSPNARLKTDGSSLKMTTVFPYCFMPLGCQRKRFRVGNHAEINQSSSNQLFAHESTIYS